MGGTLHLPVSFDPGRKQALAKGRPVESANHGITALPGLLVARYLGDNSEAARLWFAELWKVLRPACCGRPAVIPRILNT
jgi:urease accessory protein